jgi:hypothetical protein
LPWARLARDPAPRSTLRAIAASVSQAALAGKNPDVRQVGQRPVAPAGEDLLDDGVVTVLSLGLVPATRHPTFR